MTRQMDEVLSLEEAPVTGSVKLQTPTLAAALFAAAGLFWLSAVVWEGVPGPGSSYLLALLVAAVGLAGTACALSGARQHTVGVSVGESHWRTLLAVFLVLALGALLFAQPLIGAWGTGASTTAYFAGVFPYNDATWYYQGALQMLNEGRLDSWSMRRPINASLHALRLFLVDGDLRLHIALAGVAAVTATLAAAMELSRRLGLMAAVGMVLLTFAFIGTYLPTTLSSVNGYILGAFSLVLLLRAAETRSKLLFALGILLLGLGLNARAGPFLLLPMLWLWGALYLHERGWFSPLALLAGIGATVVAFMVPAVLNATWGEGDGGAQSNFAYTLYGMVVGGKGWQQIYVDHPDVFTLAGESAQASRMYELVEQQLLANPLPFVGFYLSELVRFADFCGSWLLNEGGSFLLAGGFAGLGWALLRWRQPWAGLLLTSFAGIWLSSPFLMQDGGARVFAAAIPLMVAISVHGWVAIMRLALYLFLPGSEDRYAVGGVAALSSRVLAVVGAALVTVVAIGPSAAAFIHPRDAAEPGDVCGGQQRAIVTVLGKTSYVLVVEPDESLKRSYLPVLRESDLDGNLSADLTDFAEVLRRLDAPFAFVHGYDLAWRSNGRETFPFWAVAAPEQLALRDGQRVLLCASVDDSPELKSWRNYFYRVDSVVALPTAPGG